MDHMEFNEEIQDAEYFEEKIKSWAQRIISLEDRITSLENRALVYGKWPENEKHVANMSAAMRKIISESIMEYCEIKCKENTA